MTQQSVHQVNTYVKAVVDGDQADLHIWALNSLIESNPDITKALENHLPTGDPDINGLFRTILNSTASQLENKEYLANQTGSVALLVSAMLQTDSSADRKRMAKEFRANHKIPIQTRIDYNAILDRIASKDTIGTQILPIESFNFLHFQLLYNGNSLLSRHYIDRFIVYWDQQISKYDNESLANAILIYSLFRAEYLADEYRKINRLFEKVLGNSLFPNNNLKLRALRYLDYSMYRLVYYHKALDVIRNYSIPLSQHLNDNQTQLALTMVQGSNLLNIGKFKEAKENYLDVLDQAERFNITVSKPKLYYNLGLTYFRLGEYDKYLDYQSRALKIAQDEGKTDRQMDILTALYHYEKNYQNKESAGYYLNEARKIAEQRSNHKELGIIYTSLGEYYIDLSPNYKKAQLYFSKADSLLDPVNDYQHFVSLLFEQAKLYENSGDLDMAMNIYSRIQELAEQKDDSRKVLDAQVDKAKIYLKKNKITEAGKILDRIQGEDLSLLNFEDIIKTKRIEAKYLVHIGNRSEAQEILDKVTKQIINQVRNSTEVESGYWNVNQEFLDTFDLYVTLLIESGQNKKAVLTLDRLKTINDASLYQNPIVKSSLLNEQELTRYKQLTNQIVQLRKKQIVASKNQFNQIQSQINRLNAEKRLLDRKLTKLADQRETSMLDVQRKLDGDHMVMHVTELKDRYYIAEITRRNITLRTIPLDEETRPVFQQAIESLASGKTDLHKLYKVYSLLDIDRIASDINKLVLIPDSYLYQLPLDILPLHNPADAYNYGEASYLIENMQIQYLTSLNELGSPEKPSTDHEIDFIGFGKSQFDDIQSKSLVPLPYAKKEVQHISEQLTNLPNTRTIVDQTSTESNFRLNAPNAKIIHLATHSTVSERDPLFSTIYMSNNGSSPGSQDLNSNIFAYELFEMNLTNELIMLNSCESGSGSYLQGSGIMGISRALRYAGARSLVLNLWSVNDMMASEFAIQFYKHLNQGESKSEALRAAKTHFLKQKNANPHFWGPYMMLGDDEPVVRPHEDTNRAVATGFMAYLFLLVGITFYRRRWA